jgi:tetratricopeptide (TPR) repeat protein
VFEGFNKALGAEHPETLQSVNNLGVLLETKGDCEGAEALYRRALEGLEKTLGAEHLETLRSVNNLGNLLYDKGDYEGAEVLYRRALEGKEKALGAEHPDTLGSVSNLGNLLRDKGDYEGAEALCRRALRGREKALGAEHPVTLQSLNSLSILLNATSRRNQALKLLREKASLSERVKDHVRYNLACYECLEGNFEEARHLIMEHLAKHPEVKGQALADSDLAEIRESIDAL